MKLKVTITGFVTIDPSDYADEYCEANGIDDQDDDELDEKALADFAVARFAETIEEGNDPELDDPSVSVEKVED